MTGPTIDLERTVRAGKAHLSGSDDALDGLSEPERSLVLWAAGEGKDQEIPDAARFVLAEICRQIGTESPV